MAENGRLPISSLAEVPGTPGAYLTTDAAASWGRVRAGVQAASGWTPAPTSAADCYRSYEIQERIFRQRYTAQSSGSGPFGDVRFWNGVRYVRTSGAAAAVPGTSNHGWGIAVDVASIGDFGGDRYNKFAAVAQPQNWSNTEGKSVGEPWHWVYQGPSTTPTDPVNPLMEENMPVRIRTASGGIYLVDLTRGVFRALDPTSNSAVDKLGIAIVRDGLSAIERDQIRQAVIDLATPKIDG